MKGRTKSFTLVVSLVFIFMVMFSAGNVCAEDQTYAMVVFLKGSEFFNWAYGGMQDAAKLLGADIKTELRGPATWDASQEARAIEQLIAKGVKGIIVTAGDATTLNPAIDKAMARGIPVITFDSDAPDSQRLCFAGTNNYEAGKVAGKAVSHLGQQVGGRRRDDDAHPRGCRCRSVADPRGAEPRHSHARTPRACGTIRRRRAPN